MKKLLTLLSCLLLLCSCAAAEQDAAVTPNPTPPPHPPRPGQGYSSTFTSVICIGSPFSFGPVNTSAICTSRHTPSVQRDRPT